MHLGIYQHYQGNYYQVIGVARHSETLEELIVYQSLYGDYGVWVRPVLMFNENVIFNDKTLPRFKFISDSFSKATSINEALDKQKQPNDLQITMG